MPISDRQTQRADSFPAHTASQQPSVQVILEARWWEHDLVLTSPTLIVCRFLTRSIVKLSQSCGSLSLLSPSILAEHPQVQLCPAKRSVMVLLTIPAVLSFPSLHEGCTSRMKDLTVVLRRITSENFPAQDIKRFLAFCK